MGRYSDCLDCQDHPRSRGVYLRCIPSCRAVRGSSPLARGLPIDIVAPQVNRRIIPARAGFTPSPITHRLSWWDHPRSRGVYTIHTPRNTPIVGSSPLARGLRWRVLRARRRRRIIPARAGFTLASFADGVAGADHPRSRGVYPVGRQDAVRTAGSSPLARGLLGGASSLARVDGIIPARAGFTPITGSPTSSSRDHPRSRGVYAARFRSWARAAGSSPLARGLLPWTRRTASLIRIIPARAGFTRSSPSRGSSRTDHPRSRGVYSLKILQAETLKGSSPLARGLRHCGGMAEFRNRIIPARAGFTAPPKIHHAALPDHPRSRGVYSRCSRTPTIKAGSSPLARGLPQLALDRHVHGRIIPARAGFTKCTDSASSHVRDHPRSRGVYAHDLLPDREYDGSSPLARGLHRDFFVVQLVDGIIPARAGFTLLDTVYLGNMWDHPRSRGVYTRMPAAAARVSGSSPLARGLHLAIGVIPTVGHPTRGRSPSLVT